MTSYEVWCSRCGHCSANERSCRAKEIVGEKRTIHSCSLANGGLCIFFTLDLSNTLTLVTSLEETRVGLRYPSPSHVITVSELETPAGVSTKCRSQPVRSGCLIRLCKLSRGYQIKNSSSPPSYAPVNKSPHAAVPRFLVLSLWK